MPNAAASFIYWNRSPIPMAPCGRWPASFPLARICNAAWPSSDTSKWKAPNSTAGFPLERAPAATSFAIQQSSRCPIPCRASTVLRGEASAPAQCAPATYIFTFCHARSSYNDSSMNARSGACWRSNSLRKIMLKQKPERQAWACRVFTALLLIGALHAQTGASVSGVVRDPQGQAVPGAVVTLYPQTGSEGVSTTSDPAGAYRIDALAAGAYFLRASAPGFAPFLAEDVHLAPGAAEKRDIAMQLVGIREQVVVT